jgi:hypothetical protein
MGQFVEQMHSIEGVKIAELLFGLEDLGLNLGEEKKIILVSG